MLLHVALNGDAHAIITGARDLLVLADGFLRSHGLAILAPADFLARIPQGGHWSR